MKLLLSLKCLGQSKCKFIFYVWSRKFSILPVCLFCRNDNEIMKHISVHLCERTVYALLCTFWRGAEWIVKSWQVKMTSVEYHGFKDEFVKMGILKNNFNILFLTLIYGHFYLVNINSQRFFMVNNSFYE